MKLKEFIKEKLEEKYLGKEIKSWNDKIFVVHEVSVEDGGVDPQTEICLRSKFNIDISNQYLDWTKKYNENGGSSHLVPIELKKNWEIACNESWYMTNVEDEMPDLI